MDASSSAGSDPKATRPSFRWLARYMSLRLTKKCPGRSPRGEPSRLTGFERRASPPDLQQVEAKAPARFAASIPNRKSQLATLRGFFDALALRQVVLMNPAASDKTERYAVVEGKTPETLSSTPASHESRIFTRRSEIRLRSTCESICNRQISLAPWASFPYNPP